MKATRAGDVIESVSEVALPLPSMRGRWLVPTTRSSLCRDLRNLGRFSTGQDACYSAGEPCVASRSSGGSSSSAAVLGPAAFESSRREIAGMRLPGGHSGPGQAVVKRRS